jgi:DhnA family fructose-bisphosphate aldolase class Ia
MYSTGKAMRLRHLIEPETGRAVYFAISHGTSSPVVLKGTEDVVTRVGQARRGGATACFLTAGYAKACAGELAKSADCSVLLKISSSATRYEVPHQEIFFGTVEEAMYLGAVGVVVLVPLEKENEPEIIREVGKIGEACDGYGMIFLIEAEFPTAYHVQTKKTGMEEYGLEYLQRSVRLSVELGADIVKTNWTGDMESFGELVSLSPVPVVVAGGSRESDRDLLTKLEMAIRAGAVGCSVGRNIFQHRDPEAMTRAICMVVKEGRGVDAAIDYLEGATS